MKIHLLLLIIIGFTSFIKAECYYSNYQFKLEIQTNLHKSIYYNEISACDFNIDSIQSQSYLIRVLQKKHLSDLTVFKNRFHYKYCFEEWLDCLEIEKDSISILFNKIVLKNNDIASIQIIEHTKVQAFRAAYTDTQIKSLEDAAWMKKPPVKVLYCGTYLNYYQIFVHEINNQIDKILSEIKILQSTIDELEKADQLEFNVDLYDSKISLLVSKLPIEKIVIIASQGD